MKKEKILSIEEHFKSVVKSIRAYRSKKPVTSSDYYVVEAEIRRSLSEIIRSEKSITDAKAYVSELVGFVEFKKRESRLVATLIAMGFKPTMKGAK